jgi:predicted pyridoxine 5'-phosphate oxidase superfamily flavin-nucleotide-binding protein
MGRTYAAIEDRLASFLLSQPVFFVASAPLSGEALVNCSPKSNDGELTVIDPHRVAYLDRTGSGVETIAHLRENGRVVLMFCAFEGPPRIVRIHGRGSVVARDDEGFEELSGRFPTSRLEGARSVIVVSVERIADSCGYGVPLMDFRAHRTQMAEWAERKGDEGIRQYWESTNSGSLDGLPGLGAITPG